MNDSRQTGRAYSDTPQPTAPDLASIFGGLVRHHVARQGQAEPERQTGIDWIYAANGIWKRGISASVQLQGRASRLDVEIPGLARLMPYVHWPVWPRRLPGELLAPLLTDAQRAGSAGAVATPIEKQYFFVERDGVRVVAPRAQEGTAASLRYTMPVAGTPLLDLHSHHAMRAYFSATDDRDDQGLSVSAVIGNIFERPEIVVRLNIYGLHCAAPALMVFDSLGPFVDRYYGGDHASADD